MPRLLSCALAALIALAAFSSARAAEPSDPYVQNLKRGFDALKVEDYSAALAAFDDASAAAPDKAGAHFYRGVALNRLSRHASALSALRRAESLGSDNEDLDFELGWALLRIGRMAEAKTRLLRYDAAHPGRAITGVFLARIATEEQSQPAFTFGFGLDLSLRTAGGYNDNVIGRDPDEPLPPTIDSAGSAFATIGADLRSPLVESDYGALSASLSASTEHYFSLDEFDVTEIEGALIWDFVVSDGLTLRLRGATGATWVGGELDRTRTGVRASARIALGDDLALEPSLAWAASAYEADDAVSLVQRRSGDTETGVIGAIYDLDEYRLKASVFLSRSDADGDDYDQWAPGLSLAANRSWGSGFVTSISFVRRWGLYDHDNSRAVPAFDTERRDDFERGTIELSLPVADALRVSLKGDVVQNDSNIEAFDYRQNVVTLGLTVRL